MQEVIRPPSDAERRAVARTDSLTFDRVEDAWQNVSFDKRFPVGLMPAMAAGGSEDATIHLIVDPLAVLLPGPSGIGRFRRMRQMIRFE